MIPPFVDRVGDGPFEFTTSAGADPVREQVRILAGDGGEQEPGAEGEAERVPGGEGMERAARAGAVGRRGAEGGQPERGPNLA